jgi:hypothetical protein
MAKKRKYARLGENSKKQECTNTKCKWQGTAEETAKKSTGDGWLQDVCPNCGNNDFYKLLS